MLIFHLMPVPLHLYVHTLLDLLIHQYAPLWLSLIAFETAFFALIYMLLYLFLFSSVLFLHIALCTFIFLILHPHSITMYLFCFSYPSSTDSSSHALEISSLKCPHIFVSQHQLIIFLFSSSFPDLIFQQMYLSFLIYVFLTTLLIFFLFISAATCAC